ncbi:hypothetical protein C4544_00030 [candidate division WS5 bacterium]|uniref:Homing endonuclease LAGLIDADG domain-containing protein n=1 Tax=candidate division WS5 bacterium TaxID=2093353 RepID=A0A419DGV0_9BACT|nr:MAG: hypothetical protein C4544_00030 [candidate division WS5 bacterium]
MGSQQNKDSFYAYVAGFLDGDGCIAIRFEKSKTCRLGFRARVRISFTQHKQKREVLDYLCKTIGSGVVSEYQHNNMAEYTIYDQVIIEQLLNGLEPYLIVKADHLSFAKKLIVLKRTGYSSDSLKEMHNLFKEIRSLNNYPKTILLDPVTTDNKGTRYSGT